jgi:hypothetical protein
LFYVAKIIQYSELITNFRCKFLFICFVEREEILIFAKIIPINRTTYNNKTIPL